jgi:hypothetical protein
LARFPANELVEEDLGRAIRVSLDFERVVRFRGRDRCGGKLGIPGIYGQVWNSNSSRTRFGFGVNPKIPYFGSYLYSTSQAGTGVRLGLAVHAGVLDYYAQDKITTMSNALFSFLDLIEIRCSRPIFLEIRAGRLFQFLFRF